MLIVREDEEQLLVVIISMQCMQFLQPFPGVGHEDENVQISVSDRALQMLFEGFQIRTGQSRKRLKTLLNASLQALSCFIGLMVDVEYKLYHGPHASLGLDIGDAELFTAFKIYCSNLPFIGFCR